jgi:hypothetical protein
MGNETIFDVNNPAGMLGHGGIVGNENYGDTLGVELVKHPKNFIARPRIEIACRLVSKEHLRTIDKRPCDSHALLFSTRELGGLVLNAI